MTQSRKTRKHAAAVDHVVAKALTRAQVVPAGAEARTASAIVDAINEDLSSGSKAIVAVKSPVASKIVWTQIIGFLAMIAAFFGLPIPEDQIASIEAGIVAAMAVVTLVLKTWFSPTVTPQSIGTTP